MVPVTDHLVPHMVGSGGFGLGQFGLVFALFLKGVDHGTIVRGTCGDQGLIFAVIGQSVGGGSGCIGSYRSDLPALG